MACSHGNDIPAPHVLVHRCSATRVTTYHYTNQYASRLTPPCVMAPCVQVLAELDPEADAELGLPDMVGQYHSIYPLEDVAQVGAWPRQRVVRP